MAHVPTRKLPLPYQLDADDLSKDQMLHSIHQLHDCIANINREADDAERRLEARVAELETERETSAASAQETQRAYRAEVGRLRALVTQLTAERDDARRMAVAAVTEAGRRRWHVPQPMCVPVHPAHPMFF